MRRLGLVLAVVAVWGCLTASAEILKKPFGRTADGKQVELYTLKNSNGTTVSIMTYGATVVDLLVKDRDGQFADVSLGYESLDGYIKNSPYFGAIVGRYGNRIKEGKFSLDGKDYTLATNNGPNALHGGIVGFDKVVWKADIIKSGKAVRFVYLSRDGEEGYPANLAVAVIYELRNDDALQIDYMAKSDGKTVANITNHTYFNLAGNGNGDILDHMVMINADRYTPVDSTLIPTGELAPVAATPMDFNLPKTIGERITDGFEQLIFGGGYDHNWVLNKKKPGSITFAAQVYEPTSGRMMQILTTEPGLQFYSGNFLDGTIMGKGGAPYKHRSGFCMETQHYPDSPNQPAFPSTVLEAGKLLKSRTIYKFTAK